MWCGHVGHVKMKIFFSCLYLWLRWLAWPLHWFLLLFPLGYLQGLRNRWHSFGQMISVVLVDISVGIKVGYIGLCGISPMTLQILKNCQSHTQNILSESKCSKATSRQGSIWTDPFQWMKVGHHQWAVVEIFRLSRNNIPGPEVCMFDAFISIPLSR